MHQTQWSPERPLPPPVSLTSQSHHEKPPEVTCTSRGTPGCPASTRERPRETFFFLRLLDRAARAGDEVPPDEAVAVGLRTADQHDARRTARVDFRLANGVEEREVRLGDCLAVD